MSESPSTPAQWRAKIEKLEHKLTEAEKALETAKAKAASAVLTDGPDASAAIATARDQIEAVTAALAAARKGLADAEAKVTAKDRAKAAARADEAARQRHEAARDFDHALEAAEAAYQRFLAAGVALRAHQADAGLAPLSHAKASAGEAIRGAVTASAFHLSATLDCRPYSRDSRIPLASHCVRQTPWKQKDKAA